jgi:putative iron-regulated protein
MKKCKLIFAIAAVLSLGACVDDGDDGLNGSDGVPGADGVAGTDGVSVFVTREDVVATNANIAYAAYADSLISAIELKSSLETFISAPTEATFQTAKDAWLASREPYGQTEVYRFRVGPIHGPWAKQSSTMLRRL